MSTNAVTDLNPLTQTHPARPIRYFGDEHVATKEFLWGTQRAMPPEQTLARIRSHFREVGVTRLADVTGLDRLGVPIWCSIRPYSRTLAVDSGKGATPVAAATSAAMEAIERSVAETFDDVVVEARYEEVADRAGFGPYGHPVFRDSVWSPDTIYKWTSGWNMVSNREVLLPQILIGLANRDVGLRRYWWAASSNGLASGNHFPEALCAALYEVIERDATACWQVAIEQGLSPAYLDTRTIDQPVIRGLIDQLFEAGVAPEILWCPNDFGVPVFMSFVRDLEVPELGVYKGYGCHLNPEIAMIRAVTEAVQARTLIIAGSRDDLFRATFRVLRASAANTGSHFQGAPTIEAPNIADYSTPTFHGDVAVLVDRLVSRGFDRILVRALPADHLEVSVVRVFVPGLEGYRFPWIAAGSRARTFDPSSLFV
jgi:ribosomal protein S12 methylthiotransferase accessory factor